jgi:tungstate transport system ATP-binding protein
MLAEPMRAPTTELPIAFENVTLRAGDAVLLDRISLRLDAGAPTAIIGPNGSGKTTLLRAAMGLVAPTEGRVTWGGREAGGGRRAFVFQHPVMLRRSAAANVAFALARDYSRPERAERVSEILQRVSLTHLATRAAPRLSGGERQRLALARALARDPQVLFLDEPASNLDPAATKAVETIIAETAQAGIKVVIATHDLGEARRLGGDVVFMARGRVVEHARTAEFFDAPRTAEAAAFLRGDLVI